MYLKGITPEAFSKVKYNQPRINKVGGKSISLTNPANTNDKQLNVLTPMMLTWGVNENTDEATGKKSYDMSLQFPSEDYASDDTSAFLANLKFLEEKIKNDAIENSKDWLNKTKVSSEVIDALWTPMLKYPKDKTTGELDYSRSPTLRIKLPYWDNNFNIELYDVARTKIFPDESNDSLMPSEVISKGSKVALIIQCGGIWIANGRFGVTWKLIQGVIQMKKSIQGACRFPDEMLKSMSSMMSPTEEQESPKKNQTMIENSDDEQPNHEPTPSDEVEEVKEDDDSGKKKKKKTKTKE